MQAGRLRSQRGTRTAADGSEGSLPPRRAPDTGVRQNLYIALAEIWSPSVFVPAAPEVSVTCITSIPKA